jgi:hypothetical protein
MELVIEFGFLTLFAESFILAPIAILILNKLEKYSDITRFKTFVKRPDFVRKRNIGMWQNILQVQSVIAVFTNLSLTMMSTNDNKQVAYLRSILISNKANKLKFKPSFFVLEHGVIVVLVLLWLVLVPMAKWVRLFIERREYKMKSNKWKVLIEDLDNTKDNTTVKENMVSNLRGKEKND